jgi:hypothetical protein
LEVAMSIAGWYLSARIAHIGFGLETEDEISSNSADSIRVLQNTSSLPLHEPYRYVVLLRRLNQRSGVRENMQQVSDSNKCITDA